MGKFETNNMGWARAAAADYWGKNLIRERIKGKTPRHLEPGLNYQRNFKLQENNSDYHKWCKIISLNFRHIIQLHQIADTIVLLQVLMNID